MENGFGIEDDEDSYGDEEGTPDPGETSERPIEKRANLYQEVKQSVEAYAQHPLRVSRNAIKQNTQNILQQTTPQNLGPNLIDSKQEIDHNFKSVIQPN